MFAGHCQTAADCRDYFCALQKSNIKETRERERKLKYEIMTRCAMKEEEEEEEIYILQYSYKLIIFFYFFFQSTSYTAQTISQLQIPFAISRVYRGKDLRPRVTKMFQT